jgi:uncharacterized protein YjbI with pentapeptide repeats
MESTDTAPEKRKSEQEQSEVIASNIIGINEESKKRFWFLLVLGISFLVAAFLLFFCSDDKNRWLCIWPAVASACSIFWAKKWNRKCAFIFIIVIAILGSGYFFYITSITWFIKGILLPFVAMLFLLYCATRPAAWFYGEKIKTVVHDSGQIVVFLLTVSTLGGLAFTTCSIKEDYNETKKKMESDLQKERESIRKEKEGFRLEKEAANKLIEQRLSDAQRQQEELGEKIKQGMYSAELEPLLKFAEEKDEIRRTSMILALAQYFRKSKLDRSKISKALTDHIRKLAAKTAENNISDSSYVTAEIEAAMRIVGLKVDGREKDYRPDLRNLFLPRLRLENADLSNAELSGTDFSYSYFRNVTFDNTDLNGTDFNHAQFVTPSFKKCEMTASTNFRKAKFTDAKFENTNIGSTIFHYAEMPNAMFKNVSMIGVRMNYASLDGATFDNIDGNGAIFGYSSLKGAKFIGGAITYAEFTSADVSGTSFNKTNVAGCKFQGAKNWDKVDFKNAKYKNKAVLPDERPAAE